MDREFNGRPTHGFAVQATGDDGIDRKIHVQRFVSDDGHVAFRFDFVTHWSKSEKPTETILSLSSEALSLMSTAVWTACHDIHRYPNDQGEHQGAEQS